MGRGRVIRSPCARVRSRIAYFHLPLTPPFQGGEWKTHLPISTSLALTITVTRSPTASARSAIASLVMLDVTILPPPISTRTVRAVHRAGTDLDDGAGDLVARADPHVASTHSSRMKNKRAVMLVISSNEPVRQSAPKRPRP